MKLPPIAFEWMLTDSCGQNNMGVQNGPKMNLFGITTYTPTQSTKVDNAVKFTGENSSFARSDADAVLNNQMNNNSMTVMMWVQWNNLNTACAGVHCNMFLELDNADIGRGWGFWLHSGGYFYKMSSSSGCSPCFATLLPFQPLLGTWYHVALVYDGSDGSLHVYQNGLQVAVAVAGLTTNNIIW